MKRTILAIALATAAGLTLASTPYRNDAGEADQATIQLGEASEYRFDAGEQDKHQPIADASEYRNDAGQQDKHQPQVG